MDRVALIFNILDECVSYVVVWNNVQPIVFLGKCPGVAISKVISKKGIEVRDILVMAVELMRGKAKMKASNLQQLEKQCSPTMASKLHHDMTL